ncbi:MAG: protein-tyrosine-phosphatase [Bacteroidetes bacterium]|nr:protein-tyrosine-phosphatase [Bacteroidota bacterium]
MLTIPMRENGLYPEIIGFLDKALALLPHSDPERKAQLDRLARVIGKKIAGGKVAEITFICTHNSRRSHFGQLLAAAAAECHGLGPWVKTYSGGTQATAFNERAVWALRRVGFSIKGTEGTNPVYSVHIGHHIIPIACFSKRYDHPANACHDFIAVMTCSEAEAACPVVYGAGQRIALPYADPKEWDGSPQESAMYDARALEIAGEMMYVMGRVSGRPRRH